MSHFVSESERSSSHLLDSNVTATSLGLFKCPVCCACCGLVEVKDAQYNDVTQSIGPVKLWQFVVAQTFVFPKILLSVFIGSRAAALADGDQRGHMDRCKA